MSGEKVLALAGGVGGGKFVRGLTAVLQPGELTVAVNTADDFVHHGLHISPDVDSVLYAIADLNDPLRGWGLAGETWHFMDALRRLGGENWFQLGDKDLATHVLRTQWLAEGRSLTEVTALLAGRFGIRHAVVPMSDEPVRSVIETDEGPLPFQDYFVRRQCAPEFRGIAYEGGGAEPGAAFRSAIAGADIVLIAPSNPYISVDPILQLDGVRDALRETGAAVAAVSPIVGGAAIKGPLAKMMREAGAEPSPLGVARHHGSLVRGWVIDTADAASAAVLEDNGWRVLVTGTVMRSNDDKARLARETLDFARSLRR